MNGTHLGINDFSPVDMRIKNENLKTRPFLVMLSSPGCGYCKNATPAFVSLGKKHPAFIVQSPSSNPEEMKLMSAIQSWIKDGGGNFIGYPTYYKFHPNGHMEEYKGGRDEASLEKFLLS
jgi:thiol-disulfide isomerase/thioredoxin